MRILKRLSANTGLAVTLLLIPTVCGAAGGAQALSAFIQAHIITQGLIAFWGISWAAMFYYAVRMVLTAQNEDAFTQASTSFIHAFIGFAIIACSAAFAAAFSTTGFSGVPATGVQPDILEGSIVSVSNFMIQMSAGMFVLMIVISGVRMVTTQGEEGAFDKAKKLLAMNCGGVMLMLVASSIVNGVASTDSGFINEELTGIGFFLLTLLGFLCVIALIVAGIFLIVSIDEGNRDKAKKIVIGTLITLVLVFILYTLILTFV
jgi:hypothetical protein